MSAFARLSAREIAIVRLLFSRPRDRIARSIGLMLEAHERRVAASLWRRGLVETFYRQAPDSDRSLQGPFFALSFMGWKLGKAFARPRPARARPQYSGEAAQ
jgi:hypothetical protein